MPNFLENMHARLVEELKRVGPPVVAKQVGIARATVYNWMEKGNVPMDKLPLLDAAGVDVAYILTGQSSTKETSESRAAPALSPRQVALLDNYKHTDEQGKKIIEAAAFAAAQSQGKKAARGGER